LPLELGPTSRQMDNMAQTFVDMAPVQQRFLDQARDCLHNARADALRHKLEWQTKQQVRILSLLALPPRSLVDRPAPGLSGTTPAPSAFSVVGVDVSSISPNRRRSLHYYLLDIGCARLTYGRQPDPVPEASIDREWMSQLGRRVSGKLTDDGDVDAVLTGASSHSALRGTLATLNTYQQILTMEMLLPMPIMRRTREYDESFCRATGSHVGAPRDAETDIRDLFGDQ